MLALGSARAQMYPSTEPCSWYHRCSRRSRRSSHPNRWSSLSTAGPQAQQRSSLGLSRATTGGCTQPWTPERSPADISLSLHVMSCALPINDSILLALHGVKTERLQRQDTGRDSPAVGLWLAGQLWLVQRRLERASCSSTSQWTTKAVG